MPHALLVDDDEPFVTALAEALSRESFTTRTATSLAAAKIAIAAGTPDVVLVDLHLPDGNGMELLEHLSGFPTTEVILITGEASVETAVEALRRGATDYLVKPVDLARIKSVLANVSHTRELKQLAASLPWARRKPPGDGQPAVFGRYEVEAEIGEGAMGRVFRCRDPLVGRQVAVKTVKSEYLSGASRAEYLSRFRREAQAAGILSHPSIVNIFDVGDDYMVMEYVEGATLEGLLRDERALDLSSASRVLAPLAEALDYAHQAGVIHRDIKPSNIMVQPDGRPKLMDFGVARLESSKDTRTGHVLGSPSYMAPEQILGEPLAPAADLFSFAVVAFEALTGRRPFPGDSVAGIVYRVVHEEAPPPSSLNHLLPRACDAVFARALSKDRRRRYADASSFVAALMAAGAGDELPAISPDPLLESLVSSLSLPTSATDDAGARTPAPAPAAMVPGSPTTTLNTRLPRTTRRRLYVPAAMLAIAAGVPLALLARRAMTTDEAIGPLRIETQPPGMSIWVDGRRAGRSPLKLALDPGVHRVRIAEEGYAPAELTLQLNPDTTAAPLRFVMAPLPSSPDVAAATSTAEDAPRVPVPGASPAARAARAGAGTAFWTPGEARPSAAPPTSAPPAAPVRAGDIVDLGADVQPPRRVAGLVPRYPETARRLGLSGSVLIEMTVTEHGVPEQVHVLESAGAILDGTVLEAVSSWRFEPAVRDGVKVRVRWPYRHTFTPG